MFARPDHRPNSPRAIAGAVLLAISGVLSGCAAMSESSMTAAFVDPAKYDLYECKHLEPERKRLADRAAELQGLMAKARTGVGGAAVAEVAYGNDYVSVRGQQKLVDEAWQRNRCHDAPAAAAPAPPSVPPAAAKRGARSSQ